MLRKKRQTKSLKKLLGLPAGADLGFSRGGGADFQKIIEHFDDLFFIG